VEGLGPGVGGGEVAGDDDFGGVEEAGDLGEVGVAEAV